MSRRGASGAARALVGGGAADLFDEQRVDAPVRVETGDARDAGVDDQAHAVDGQRGLGDVGADDDLPLAGITRDGGVLFGGREFAVERQREPVAQARVVADFVERAADLVRAGHEDERVAFRKRPGEAGQLLGGEFPRGDAVERRGAGEVLGRDRERPPAGGQRLAGGEVFFQQAGFQRGGHDDQLQVGTGRFLDAERAGEGDVAVEVAFVEFVEEDRADAAQRRVAEHLAQEDALGDVLDAGACAGDVVQADAVADLRAERDATLPRDAGGEHPRGQTARLEDDDAPAFAEQVGVEEHLRDLRGLARAGRGLEDEAAAAGGVAQGGDERAFEFVDGQAFVGGHRGDDNAAAMRCHPTLPISSRSPSPCAFQSTILEREGKDACPFFFALARTDRQGGERAWTGSSPAWK